jgi:uncharacterized protein involved in response to NO
MKSQLPHNLVRHNSETGRNATVYPAVLAYGFRPFFLLAGIHASIAIPLWGAMLEGLDLAGLALPAHVWHAHEMLFGFVAAAVAGFLLTAVPSWTNRRGYAGAPLAGLVLLWIAGRAVTTIPMDLSPLWIAVIDLAFVPMLALTILPALVRSGNRRNLVFIGLLALLFASNLHFHLSGAVATGPLLLGMNVMLFMLTMLGGRIVPAFTSAALKQQGLEAQIRRYQPLDKAVLIGVGGVLVVDLVFPNGSLALLVAVVTALLLCVQLSKWQGHRTLKIPIVWVLHAAYMWLPVCLALKAAWMIGAPVPGTSWLHALTVGAIATMIMGVMSRASLGHTGRALVAPGGIVVAYYLVTGAALSRVFGLILFPATWALWMVVAAFLWCLAFVLFVVIYAPILCRPRIDGRPG